MHDRQPGAPGQYKAVVTTTELLKMQNGEQFTITMTRDDQPIVEGTPYSKAAVLPDDLADIICPDVADPTPADALRALQAAKAPASAIGTNKVFSKLTDIGITEFPTTMKAVAAAMPNNSTLMLDSRDIISGGTNEISDLGLTYQGMYMFMKGNTTARLSLLHIYSTTSGSTCYMNYGGYAMTTDVVTWIIGERQDSTYPDCRWRTAADGVGEWINPPMVLGEEYRTTERWNGKPVYTQLVNFGALPDNTTKSVTVTASGVTDVVGYEARYSDGKSGAVLYSGGDVISSFTIQSGKFTFSVTAPANSSGYSLMILFKYVK